MKILGESSFAGGEFVVRVSSREMEVLRIALTTKTLEDISDEEVMEMRSGWRVFDVGHLFWVTRMFEPDGVRFGCTPHDFIRGFEMARRLPLCSGYGCISRNIYYLVPDGDGSRLRAAVLDSCRQDGNPGSWSDSAAGRRNVERDKKDFARLDAIISRFEGNIFVPWKEEKTNAKS